MLLEQPFIQWGENLMYRLLDQSVHRRRYAQLTHATVRFRYLHSSHRLRFVSAIQQLFFDVQPVLTQIVVQIIHAHAVYSGRSVVRLDPFVSQLQIRPFNHSFEKMNPTLRISCPCRAS